MVCAREARVSIRDNTDVASAGCVSHGHGLLWTEAQTEFLRKHARWPDAKLVTAISALGPPRTLSAIKGKRAQQRLPKAPQDRDPREWLAEGYARHLQAQKGWPVMKGEHEERDRQFQRKLWQAQLSAIRSQSINHLSD